MKYLYKSTNNDQINTLLISLQDQIQTLIPTFDEQLTQFQDHILTLYFNEHNEYQKDNKLDVCVLSDFIENQLNNPSNNSDQAFRDYIKIQTYLNILSQCENVNKYLLKKVQNKGTKLQHIFYHRKDKFYKLMFNCISEIISSDYLKIELEMIKENIIQKISL